ncbi:MAG: hypothetical protein SGILL_007166 [Bacillariaceae sp.]
MSTAKRQYIVGGNSFHVPILEYLTWRLQDDFSPPINFTRMTANVYLKFPPSELDTDRFDYDFVVSNSYIASCFQSEQATHAIATQLHVSPGYNLSEYGAVLYTLSNRTDIRSIQDVKGKKIGTNKITGLATHLCYDVLLRNGIHNLQDPLQTIFFKHSRDALKMVLSGDIDVGCAATSILEEYVVDEETGEKLDLSQIRVLNPVENATTTMGGKEEPFPHLLSSQLVPSYLFQAYPHVETAVVNAVQRELLALKAHADVGPSLLGCLDANSCSTDNTLCVENCFTTLPQGAVTNCDTTPDIVLAAFRALNESGLVGGFIEPLQNLKLRDIQETTGFLVKSHEEEVPRCVRMNNIVDATTCPPGHFARSSEEIQQQCNVSGLDCFDDQPCICNPCIKAYEVDFFTTPEEDLLAMTNASSMVGSGCSKFSICGHVGQEHVLTFQAIDNKERVGSTLTGAFLLEDESELNFTFVNKNGTFEYDWHATSTPAGQKTIKIRLDEEEIPESPFRIVVDKRDCAGDTGDDRREPNEYGQCVCMDGTVEIANKCVYLAVLIPIILVILVLLLALGMHFYLRHKKKQAENIWQINPSELSFEEPPRVLGRGSFGLVLMAEYRGTQVAVKRVLPPECGNYSSTIMPSAIEFKLKTSTDVLKPQQDSQDTEKVMSATADDAKATSLEDMEAAPALSPNEARARTAVSTIGMRSVVTKIKDQNGGKDAKKIAPYQAFLNQRRKARSREQFIEEIRLLSRLRHPNITTVMGAVISSKWEPMMVMEYMHFGSLHDLLHNESMFLDSDLRVGFLQDIANGLRFLHSSNPPILHGDMKSHNILVDDKFRAKVSDFGCGEFRSDDATTFYKGSNNTAKARGTPYWMAPELLRNECGNTLESDVYSFGIVLYEVMSRKEPYEGEDYDEVMKLVADPKINKRPPVPRKCPSEVARIMQACLKPEPDLRPTAMGLDICLRWMGSGTPATNSTSITSHTQTVTDRVGESHNTGAEASSPPPLETLPELEQAPAPQENAASPATGSFPADIADAVKQGKEVEPQIHNDVTVVLSTISGIDRLSRSISEEKVGDLLRRWRICLDDICHDLDVFTVETVGDTHMAVTNLTDDQQDNHASLAAKFAAKASLQSMKIPIDEDDSSSGFVELCVGLHSGPVVSHVIGRRFTLIGDTVNMAGYLQTYCPPGKIQCSDQTYYLLSGSFRDQDSFDVMPRGMIPVKGLGDMMAYWIEPNLDQVDSHNPSFATAFFNM